MTKTFAPLTTFKVTYDNGSSYITSMAAGVTLADAEKYFLGVVVLSLDEKTKATIVKVEKID